jgi:PAS fold
MSDIYTEVYERDLHAHLRNAGASFAYTCWQVACGSRDIPEEAAFLRFRLEWIRPDWMILDRTPDGDLLYSEYGARIAQHAGFDMTGKRVSDFKGALGAFFQMHYARAIHERRVLATVHRLGNFGERPLWERIILPVATEGEITRLYVVNRVRDLGRDIGHAAAHARGEALIILQFFSETEKDERSIVIVGANKAAQVMTGRRLDEMLNRPMIECFPGVVAHGLVDRYFQVAVSREPQSFVQRYEQDGMSGSFDVTLSPFLDGVTIKFRPVADRLAALESDPEADVVFAA